MAVDPNEGRLMTLKYSSFRVWLLCTKHRHIAHALYGSGGDLFDVVLLLLCDTFFFFFFFNLPHSRWTSSLPSCLWSLRIFPSLPGSRLTISYRDASSALLQLVNQSLNFTYSRSHAFRYERKNTNPTLVRIELTTSALAGVQITY